MDIITENNFGKTKKNKDLKNFTFRPPIPKTTPAQDRVDQLIQLEKMRILTSKHSSNTGNVPDNNAHSPTTTSNPSTGNLTEQKTFPSYSRTTIQFSNVSDIGSGNNNDFNNNDFNNNDFNNNDNIESFGGIKQIIRSSSNGGTTNFNDSEIVSPYRDPGSNQSGGGVNFIFTPEKDDFLKVVENIKLLLGNVSGDASTNLVMFMEIFCKKFIDVASYFICGDLIGANILWYKKRLESRGLWNAERDTLKTILAQGDFQQISWDKGYENVSPRVAFCSFKSSPTIAKLVFSFLKELMGKEKTLTQEDTTPTLGVQLHNGFKLLKMLLMHADAEEHDIFMFMIKNQESVALEFIELFKEEIGDLLFRTNKFGDGAFAIACAKSTAVAKNLIKNFPENISKIIPQKNNRAQSAFHIACDSNPLLAMDLIDIFGYEIEREIFYVPPNKENVRKADQLVDVPRRMPYSCLGDMVTKQPFLFEKIMDRFPEAIRRNLLSSMDTKHNILFRLAEIHVNETPPQNKPKPQNSTTAPSTESWVKKNNHLRSNLPNNNYSNELNNNCSNELEIGYDTTEKILMNIIEKYPDEVLHVIMKVQDVRGNSLLSLVSQFHTQTVLNKLISQYGRKIFKKLFQENVDTLMPINFICECFPQLVHEVFDKCMSRGNDTETNTLLGKFLDDCIYRKYSPKILDSALLTVPPKNFNNIIGYISRKKTKDYIETYMKRTHGVLIL